MKKILKTNKWFIPLTLSFGMMMVSMGCQDEVSVNCDGDQAQPVEQFYEGEYDVTNCQFQNIAIKSGENNLVIKNQNDYEKFVTCNDDLPNIDFDKYFIIAGVYRHHQCVIFDNQSVVLCENKIVYRVKMLEQICAAFTNINYFAVIDIKYQNLPVVFDIKFLN